MRTLWACEVTGGPFRYTGEELGEAHKQLHITSDEFDEVGAEIDRALDHFNVPEPERSGILGRHRREEGRGGQSFPVRTATAPPSTPSRCQRGGSRRGRDLAAATSQNLFAASRRGQMLLAPAIAEAAQGENDEHDQDQ